MRDTEQHAAAKKFVKEWTGKGYEKGECQKFWLDLLCNVFGVKDFASFILFEEQVKDYTQSKTITNFIDACIPSTRVMIEQKSSDKDLREPTRQSDGRMLTPFQQAKKYVADLPLSKHPRWIVTCNFNEFLIYDMERPGGEPQQILLKDLPKEYYRLQFLIDSKKENIRREEEISLKAGELVGKIYDSLLPEFGDKPTNADYHALNVFCVRLVFCLYAEDAGIFKKEQFYHYLKSFRPENMRVALRELFRVLDTPKENRDRFMEDKLADFPYVNGSLFHENEGEIIPPISEKTAETLLNRASLDFDWSEISPTIFGAVFESTLNPETRRSGGMHYTSIENIHKVIDPLFLDDLKNEFHEIVPSMGRVLTKTQRQKLLALQDKLGSLKFLDPACGSGNFLTETYTSLRKLENQILMQLMDDKIVMGEIANPVKVDITQFYGIEINDFAVNVAKSALWIAESQMLKETETIVQRDIDFLPLKTNATIIEGNALRMDWENLHEYAPEPTFFADKVNVVSPKDIDQSNPLIVAEPRKHYDAITVVTEDLHVGKSFDTTHKKNNYDYIMGNPPFVGASMMSKEQKDEAVSIFGKGKRVNSIDYVGAWYYKAAKLIQNTKIKCAFVSTNSITQGEQVYPLWSKLFEQYNIQVNFAYRTFRWDSESENKAHVHCVIIGFSSSNVIANPEGVKQSSKRIFLPDGSVSVVGNINPYLIDAPNILIDSRQVPICKVPQITYGNKPADGGNLILSQEEKDALIAKDASAATYIRRYIGAKDFINNDSIRYCLWLKNVPPSAYRKNTEIMRRLQAVKEMRLASSAAPTRACAEKPYLFFSTPQTENNYLCIPEVSSERRRYIPIGFMPSSIIAANTVVIIPDATLFHFGILTSRVHMAWVRTVCGRLESRYRYAGSIVYNNFPWCEPSEKQKAKIEQTAQNILDIRAKYPDSSLADLYDELTMPTDLRKAHAENDKAVMEAYGFSTQMTEEEIVAELFKMYRELTQKSS